MMSLPSPGARPLFEIIRVVGRHVLWTVLLRLRCRRRLTTHRMTSSSSPPGHFRRSASVSTTIPSFEGRAGSAGRASGAGKVTLVGFCGAGSGTRRWFFGLASHKGRPQRPHTLSLSFTHSHSHTLTDTHTLSRGGSSQMASARVDK